MAKVTKEFMGAADGDPRTRRFMPGDTVTGDLGAVAVREGWADDEAAEATHVESRKFAPAETAASRALTRDEVKTAESTAPEPAARSRSRVNRKPKRKG